MSEVADIDSTLSLAAFHLSTEFILFYFFFPPTQIAKLKDNRQNTKDLQSHN